MDVAKLEETLLGLMRGEFSSLTLNYNDASAPNYKSVDQGIADGLYDHADWISEDSKRRAIETNRAWVLQWYPNTPVGFNSIVAATLVEIVEWIVNWDGKSQP